MSVFEISAILIVCVAFISMLVWFFIEDVRFQKHEDWLESQLFELRREGEWVACE